MFDRMRRLALLLALAPLAGCPAQQGAESGGESAGDGPTLASEDDKTIYAMGYFVMKRAGDFELDEREQEIAAAGARDALAGAEPQVDLQTYQQKISALYRDRKSAGAAEEKSASQAWVDELAQEPDAVVTDSGLVFIPVEPGEGPSPEPTDTVKVHYHGTLRDGAVFDSSRERGTPAVFPLNRVIPCWTEALQRMSVGGKARVICPSDIAYGDRGAPPKIEPGAALHFDVELLEIVEGG
jgi:FKBP-type peptidyl-prolyl cis-trans isomerase